MIKVNHLTSPKYGQLKEKQSKMLQDITSVHVESFNHFLIEGVETIVENLQPVEFSLKDEGAEEGSEMRISLEVKRIRIHSPEVSSANKYVGRSKLYPSECRQSKEPYSGNMEISLGYSCSNGMTGVVDRFAGAMPIMVKSIACNIANLKPAELVKKGEEAEEMGGYFIINGNEKILRLIIQQRRNYPFCMKRSAWKNRGKDYTEFGVSMRCVRADQSAQSMILHYLESGTCKLQVSIGMSMFFLPIIVILRGLQDVSDKFIYDALVAGREDDAFFKRSVVYMLRQLLKEGLHSQAAVVAHVGKTFRVKLYLPYWYSDEECGHYLLEKNVCVHLDNNTDKFNLLVFMTKKLFAFVNGECAPESADNPMLQEVVTPGQLVQMVLRQKCMDFLTDCRYHILKMVSKNGGKFDGTQGEIMEATRFVPTLTPTFLQLISVGRLGKPAQLGMSQGDGLSVVADKLNFARYISHFRAVHRGKFFTEMRTTAVRKLLPEAWGFLCPVHTPDGTPCGLLNHMSAYCRVVTSSFPSDKLRQILIELGVVPITSPPSWPLSECYSIVLDGCPVGFVSAEALDSLVSALRILKVKGRGEVPFGLEICVVKRTGVASQYPGLFLFSTPSRFIRPVFNINMNAVEMIGTFEQVYLDIALNKDETKPGVTTHAELSEHGILSVIAHMTPFSDFNQSPRNMYQCQMGKQTMGFPLHSFDHRADHKLYRIQTPQSPLVRPKIYDAYNMDEYPLGTNAVVAVISYTGYDMEDAMILNKSSCERGFAHASVILSEHVNLPKEHRASKLAFAFGCDPKNVSDGLDIDGLPVVGTKLCKGDPYYSYLNLQTNSYTVVKYKSEETAYLLQIKVIGDQDGTCHMNHVCFVLRVERNASIGDKFSSRHGQKGVASMLWPTEDVPFTESGMVPDIIFNPHGFPSRMTIGMMLEQMAGKAGALHGMFFDATPFTFSEDQPASDYFGQILKAGGYNYHGTERMYSGITGQEMEADIYVGLIYYQRLRHMVSDKFQVRTTGPVNPLTQQPVKGRRRHGGIRFGEMERDGLIAHGTSFLLQDRLFNCSDKSVAMICSNCNSIISPLFMRHAEDQSGLPNAKFEHQTVCQHCHKREDIHKLAVPFSFRYLVAELAGVGITTSIDVKPNHL